MTNAQAIERTEKLLVCARAYRFLARIKGVDPVPVNATPFQKAYLDDTIAELLDAEIRSLEKVRSEKQFLKLAPNLYVVLSLAVTKLGVAKRINYIIT